MKKLLVLLVLLGAIGVVGDRLAEAYTEDQVDSSLRAGLRQVGSVETDISSFPFLGRIVVAGQVAEATIVLTDVVEQEVPVAQLRLRVTGLRFDRGSIVDSGKLRITGVDSVQVGLRVTRDDLRAAFGSGVDAAFTALDGAEVQVGPDGITVAGVTVPLPLAGLVPCAAVASVSADAIDLACTADRLPSIVVEAIGSVDLREQLGV